MHTARLVTLTPSIEENIVYMARVSNPKGQGNHSTAPRLLRYLIEHGHWSPFEMAAMCVEIETTRSIAAQILRHRSFSFQEFSQRYAEVSELPAIELPHLRRQDLKNRQASHDDMEIDTILRLELQIERHFAQGLDLYHELLRSGVAKECARDVLPMGTPTRIYMNGSIRSWIHYLKIRTSVETQLEHRKVADSIKEIFAAELPTIYEAAFC